MLKNNQFVSLTVRSFPYFNPVGVAMGVCRFALDGWIVLWVCDAVRRGIAVAWVTSQSLWKARILPVGGCNKKLFQSAILPVEPCNDEAMMRTAQNMDVSMVDFEISSIYVCQLQKLEEERDNNLQSTFYRTINVRDKKSVLVINGWLDRDWTWNPVFVQSLSRLCQISVQLAVG